MIQGSCHCGAMRWEFDGVLAEPGPGAKIPIRRFDGLGSFIDLPVDGRCVADFWS
jgi:hypothetical protein